MIVLDPVYLPTGEIYANIDGQEMTVPICRGNYFYDEISKQVESGELSILPVIRPSAEIQLRDKRDMFLQQTDVPWGLADYQHPNKQAWLDYRQALRDLPETEDPQLDENGDLTNVTWTEPPAT
jgi:hypothetical protein